jgi:hypothetical protein
MGGPIAVVFDFVHPVGPRRRLMGKRRDAGRDKSVSPDARSNHHPKLASTSHRPRHRRVIIRALKAVPANAGLGRHALLVAGEIAGC